jgi:hypothetical protein
MWAVIDFGFEPIITIFAFSAILVTLFIKRTNRHNNK